MGQCVCVLGAVCGVTVCWVRVGTTHLDRAVMSCCRLSAAAPAPCLCRTRHACQQRGVCEALSTHSLPWTCGLHMWVITSTTTTKLGPTSAVCNRFASSRSSDVTRGQGS